MPSLEVVNLQLKSLDATSSFLTRKEISELPSILWEGENLRGSMQGSYNNRIGLGRSKKKSKGVITNANFDAQKAKILSAMLA